MDTITPVLRDSNLYRYQGFCFFKELMPPEYIDSLQNFKIKEDDVFMITYPKSGTIWTQHILSLIYSEGYRNGTEQIETSERIPWIEFQFLHKNDHNSRPSPRLFASHLSSRFVPQGLKNRKAKVIYVMRNPKDVIKSLYHFEAMAAFAETSPDFDHFFMKFLEGDVFAGSWFDHVLGWYKHKEDFNILFIKYEDMIMDLRSVVKQICTFLGKALDDESLDIVVKKATFNEMKKEPLANKENMPEEFFDSKVGQFMRKGTIGDWKNTMTVAQSEAFDRIYQEKMGDVDLHFTWDMN
ncbi:amine sulfotransferase-like [Hyla sarda]|uniref:amine sulfotransferase-like n=1 Tax=Hyla sarda TaxID=327740 RepID=UPI0024C46DF9|nr:amine sulfotransferase-like [Hyla sarda]XP_056422388.1 amine sulfotransferase-like [Hyla sarda]